MGNTISISVVIPVYNGGEMFRRCLSSLFRESNCCHEVIVVADGDTDGSWLLAHSCGAKVLRLASSHGPAAARNLGAREASGDILFFVDADVEIAHDTLDQIAAAFSEHPQLSAIIGSYDDAPSATNFLSQYRNLLHHIVHQTSHENASTFWGACGAIRRQDFLAVGGFDESYRHPSIEDIELGYRLRRSGYEIRLIKGIQVKHLKCWTAASILKTDFLRRALPWTALILQQGELLNDLNLKTSARASILTSYLMLGLLSCSLLETGFLWIAFCLALILLLLNAPIYHFFYKRRGLVFTLKVFPWHWLYFLYSGLAFGIGLMLWHLFPEQFTWITGRSRQTGTRPTAPIPWVPEQLPSSAN